VGDFDEAKVTALLKELFEGWKSPTPFAHVPVKHGDVAPANLAIATPDKENAIFLARQNLDLRDDDPDYPALYIANYILGGESGLDSRLMDRLRQKEGLSYSAGSSLNVPAIDRSARWTAPRSPRRRTSPRWRRDSRKARQGAQGRLHGGRTAAAKSGAIQQRVHDPLPGRGPWPAGGPSTHSTTGARSPSQGLRGSTPRAHRRRRQRRPAQVPGSGQAHHRQGRRLLQEIGDGS